MVDLLQVEDLDRLNIIHVTGTKGKVRRAGSAVGAWGGEGGHQHLWLRLPLPWYRGF